MRGAGEPIFEHYFPPGCDMMGDIRKEVWAGERMEFELVSRLYQFSSMSNSAFDDQ